VASGLRRFRELLGHAERFVGLESLHAQSVCPGHRSHRCADRGGTRGPGLLAGSAQDARDVATQLDVARTIHFAHPTAANQRQDFVSAEAGAGAQDQDLFGVADYTEGTPSQAPGVSQLARPHAKEVPEPLLFNTSRVAAELPWVNDRRNTSRLPCGSDTFRLATTLRVERATGRKQESLPVRAGLVNGKTYYYLVQAMDANCNEIGRSNDAAVRVPNGR
jgi:hypothetical protein